VRTGQDRTGQDRRLACFYFILFYFTLRRFDFLGNNKRLGEIRDWEKEDKHDNN
jgi:hypothetical protein